MRVSMLHTPPSGHFHYSIFGINPPQIECFEGFHNRPTAPVIASALSRLGILPSVAIWFGLVATGLQAQSTGTALVRHAPTINGRVEGSVQMMTGENVTFNSSAFVTGNLLVPGTPAVNGKGKREGQKGSCFTIYLDAPDWLGRLPAWRAS